MSHTVSVRTGVTYREAAARDLTADLYLPDDPEPSPAVGLVHGGGWEDDHQGMFRHHLSHLAKHGYVGVDLTHRLSGTATFPAGLDDVRAAVRWLRREADRFGLDPDRVALGGHSSGAHLAALAAVAPEEVDGVASEVQAVLPLNGPYDLERLGQIPPEDLYISGFVERLFGGPREEFPDAYREATVQAHLTGEEPPFCIFTGTDDGEVPPEEAYRLHEALSDRGVVAELEVADGGDHLAYTHGNPFYEEGVARMHWFLDEHL